MRLERGPTNSRQAAPLTDGSHESPTLRTARRFGLGEGVKVDSFWPAHAKDAALGIGRMKLEEKTAVAIGLDGGRHRRIGSRPQASIRRPLTEALGCSSDRRTRGNGSGSTSAVRPRSTVQRLAAA